MSKKSRRRNKKLLAMLALAGGAAMMGRKGNVSKTAAMEDANIGTNAPILGTDHIKKVVAPVDTAPVVKKPVDHSFQTPFKRKVDGKWMGPNEIRMLNAQTAGNKVPPSMRGGALHAEGYQRRVPGGGRKTPSWTGGYSLYKKGGRVTGIAKRGFGRALMKGKK